MASKSFRLNKVLLLPICLNVLDILEAGPIAYTNQNTTKLSIKKDIGNKACHLQKTSQIDHRTLLVRPQYEASTVVETQVFLQAGWYIKLTRNIKQF